MVKLLLKNKNIIYGLIVFIAFAFVWNNYQIGISKRTIKPIKLPAIISGKCGIEQCHGFNVTCGPNIAEICTEEMQLGDYCRQYVHCEKINNKCQLIKDPQFTGCKSCIERCERENDPENAFQCADDCIGEISKVIFNNQIFVPAKCISPSSSQVIEIGKTEEGHNVYQEKTGKNEGILLKRQDGDYQCFIKS